MYINPQTNIRLLTNVPLDTTYEHTIYFESASAQHTYFAGLQKYNLTNYTYQRVKKGVARVGIKADNLYDCNYMMFQNTAYGNKWFYAFITSVEFVNNECSEITFELDVMQTWFFDCEPDYCFVEREHSLTDNLWENLVPENLELGDYIITSKDTFDMSPLSVCALTSKTSEGAEPTGKTINHVYTPMNVIAGIPADDAQAINALLKGFTEEGKENAIAAIYQYPDFLGDASTVTPQTIGKKLTTNFETIDGYKPKNKKLFSYPYSMLVVSNNCGQTGEYRWEQWNTPEESGSFKIQGVFVTTPCVICFPYNYRGVEEDIDSGLTYSNFPQVAWVGDAYKQWFAQNKNTLALGAVSSVVSGVVTSATKGYVAGATSVLSDVSNLVAKSMDLQNTPPQVHGQVQCDSLNVGTGRCEFTFLQMCVRNQFARIIDEYFNMFGYATKRCKIPNRNSRPHWNYVKTVGATVTGSVPADDMRKICSIYDNGITFWKNGSEVGQYNLDNTV